MTPELIERLKQSCKLMAEKMPEKFRYNEQTIETLTTWTAWTFSIPNYSAIIFFNGKEIQTTQDSIDALASLLPEPRRMLLSRGTTNDLEKCFVVDYLDMNWDYIITAPALTQLWINKNITDKLSALVEGFCAEVERQLK